MSLGKDIPIKDHKEYTLRVKKKVRHHARDVYSKYIAFIS
jgi:hypothetical protein